MGSNGYSSTLFPELMSGDSLLRTSRGTPQYGSEARLRLRTDISTNMARSLDDVMLVSMFSRRLIDKSKLFPVSCELECTVCLWKSTYCFRPSCLQGVISPLYLRSGSVNYLHI